MNIGALGNYFKDYTQCTNKCSFWDTSRQRNAGYSRVNCLLACNNFYSDLARTRAESIPAKPKLLTENASRLPLGNYVNNKYIYGPYLNLDSQNITYSESKAKYEPPIRCENVVPSFREYSPLIKNQWQLKNVNDAYNIENCINQCKLNIPFMTNHNKQSCIDKCQNMRVFRRNYTLL